MSVGRCFVFWKHSFPAARSCYKASLTITTSMRYKNIHLGYTALAILPGNQWTSIVDFHT